MSQKSAFSVALGVLFLASGFTTFYALKLANIHKSTSSCQIPPSTDFKTADLEKSVFDLINQYRVSLGLPKLILDQTIVEQARSHSQNMAKGIVPFSHQGFERRYQAIAIGQTSAAENVAFNKGYSAPVAEAVSGWLNSPHHLLNIKGDYNRTGIGVAINSKGEVYLTQLFLNNRKFEVSHHKQ